MEYIKRGGEQMELRRRIKEFAVEEQGVGVIELVLILVEIFTL